jgi:hypothetical protein
MDLSFLTLTFSVGYLLLTALWFAFVIWMVVDSVRTSGFSYWIWIILVFQPIGAIVYFILNVLPTLGTARMWDRMVSSQKRIRQLKGQIHDMDRPYHWAKLGDEYREARKWDDAAKCYEEALAREKENEEARYGLGRVRLQQKRWEAAVDMLAPLIAAQATYDFGAGPLALARAWRGMNRPDEALGAYEKVLSRYTYAEARYEYATLLFERGDREKAAGLLKQLAADGRNATGFNGASDRRWGRKAAFFLKRHPV